MNFAIRFFAEAAHYDISSNAVCERKNVENQIVWFKCGQDDSHI